MSESEPKVSRQVAAKPRGGKRPGAGRPKKSAATPSSLAAVDVAAALAAEPPDEIEGVAQRHARAALDALIKILTGGSSESARISAAKEVLDRGFGKPSVDVGGETLPLFGRAPDRSVAIEVRMEAQRHAYLAVEVLKKIAENGRGESSRALAAKALLDRGIGTVAPAKGLSEIGAPLGKKEEAKRAAEAAGTGRYAPRPPPGSRRSETFQ
jgi:hypothetical protein